MNDRFKFRVPVFYDGKFKAFKKYSICNGVIVWEEPETIGELWIEDELKRNNPHLKFGSDEQCTGLKDKNGKHIYEGDIFKATVINSFPDDKCLNKTIIAQVSYFSKECAFAFSSYQPINLFEIEVIGNIHENPELLK